MARVRERSRVPRSIRQAGDWPLAAVWAGDELLAWTHGFAFGPDSDGSRSVASPALSPRSRAALVWTGSQLLVWGGCDASVPQCDDSGGLHGLSDGASYDRATDTWTMLPASPLAPRSRPAAVWTGTEMLVWGGHVHPARPGAYGAAYDPSTRTWRTLAEAPITERSNVAVVWSGAELIVWGGIDPAGAYLGDGAAYDPTTDAWRALPESPLSPRDRAAAVWAGDSMVIVGGCCPGGGSAVYLPGPEVLPPAPVVDAPPAVDLPADPLIAHGYSVGLVELDPSTGGTVRSLDVRTGEGTAPVSVTPDGDAVYLSRIETGCWTDVVRVPLDGGREEVLGAGEWPAVSPDGARLAYLRGDPCRIDELRLWIRDLATGEEWPAAEAPDGQRFHGAPAWDPQGVTVAVATQPVGPYGDPTGASHVLTAFASGPPPTAHPGPFLLRPDDHTIGWTAPTYAGEDLLVIEHCCDIGTGHPVERSRVLAVDPGTGQVRRTILDTAGWLTWLEADAAGSEVLLVVTTPHVDGVSGQRDSLHVLTVADGAVRPLREDITTASW